MLWLRRKFDWKIILLATFFARYAWFALILLINRFFQIEIPINESAAVENYFGIIKLPKWCSSTSLAAVCFAVADLLRFNGFLFPVNSATVRADWLCEPVL